MEGSSGAVCVIVILVPVVCLQSSMLADEGEPKAIPDFPAVLGKDGADGKEYKPFSKSTPVGVCC